MINSLYLLIHNRIKRLKDKDGYVYRKDIINYLRYPFSIEKHIRDIIIREMIELGLLKRINSQKYLYIENKKSEKITDVREAQLMTKFYEKKWFKDI